MRAPTGAAPHPVAKTVAQGQWRVRPPVAGHARARGGSHAVDGSRIPDPARKDGRVARLMDELNWRRGARSSSRPGAGRRPRADVPPADADGRSRDRHHRRRRPRRVLRPDDGQHQTSSRPGSMASATDRSTASTRPPCPAVRLRARHRHRSRPSRPSRTPVPTWPNPRSQPPGRSLAPAGGLFRARSQGPDTERPRPGEPGRGRVTRETQAGTGNRLLDRARRPSSPTPSS